jgi:hypothetical protein
LCLCGDTQGRNDEKGYKGEWKESASRLHDDFSGISTVNRECAQVFVSC